MESNRLNSAASRRALRNRTWADARDPPAALAPVSPSSTNWKTRAAVIELTSLLTDFDAGAVEFVESHGYVLQPAFTADAWSQFVQRVQVFAFSDALALLEETARAQGFAGA